MFYQVLVILAALILSACTPRPPDVPACEHLGERLTTNLTNGHVILIPSPTCQKNIGEASCAHCVNIVSGKEFFIGENPKNWFKGKPWSKLRAQSVYLPAQESYAPLATYVINSCKKMGCSNDVSRFKVKLDSLKSVVTLP